MAFMFKLEREDGTPADPPTLRTAVPNSDASDSILLGRDRTLRCVIGDSVSPELGPEPRHEVDAAHRRPRLAHRRDRRREFSPLPPT
jgi:hypothetical protein